MLIERQKIQRDFRPLVILLLSAAVVFLFALLVVEKNNTQRKNYSAHAVQTPQGAQLSAPVVEWKLVTAWPKKFPGLGDAPEHLAQKVYAMSNGRFHIKVFGANEIVPALGVFDAVSSGTVQAGHSGAYYWKGKIPASVFFTSIPFGMNAQEANAWLYAGGGLELWRKIYAPFNLIPFPGGNTGVQMAGWFNKRIDKLSDVKGLRMRIPGLGGDVLKRIGGEPINIAGGELYTALQTGVIDATEWVGPYNDLAFGFQDIAQYYYYPGWHEPGSTLEFVVNRQAWERLPEDLRQIFDVATQAVNLQLLNQYTARNYRALQQLLRDPRVDLRPLPNDVILSLKKASREVIEQLVNSDEEAKEVYESYHNFAHTVAEYHRVSEKAYYDARALTQ